jgi:hypothetical protein
MEKTAQNGKLQANTMMTISEKMVVGISKGESTKF